MPIVWNSLWLVQGEKNPIRKLSDEQVYEIRRRFDAGENPRVIQRDMPVSLEVVRKVARRLSWKHLEERE